MKLIFLVLVFGGNAQDDFLPSRQGARWIYRSGAQEVVLTVAGTEKVGGVACVVLQTKRGVSTERVWIQNSRKGLQIRRVMSRGKVNDLRSPALLLKLPLKKGDTWKAQIPFGNEVVEYDYRNLGQVKIRVPAGEFLAWKIEARVRVSGKRSTQVSWYSKKAGWLVKQTTAGRGMELKSFLK
jgi:hypothetical protein